MHIVFYILDSLRPDHLSCYGYERETSPHIDALAQDGLLYEKCFTSTTWTRPVAASILTGTYPTVHRTRSRQEMFTTPLTRLPELLQAKGFKTAGFTTMGNLASDIGFARGFDEYFDLFRDPEILSKRESLDAAKEGLLSNQDEKIALPRADDIHQPLFQWLTANKQEHTFSFIWSIETHLPYKPPGDFRRFSVPDPAIKNEGAYSDIRNAAESDRQRLIALYDDGVLFNDHCIGRIVDFFRTQGLYDEAMFVITGDHGEAFYEHGTYGHGHIPYDELIHVPLVIKMPNQHYAGTRLTGLSELIDLYPTILEAAAVDMAKENIVQGRNLINLAEDVGQELHEAVFSETQSLEIHNSYRSIRNHQWKLVTIQGPKRTIKTYFNLVRHIYERRMAIDLFKHPVYFFKSYFRKPGGLLFNLVNDPGEQNNVIVDFPEIADQLKQELLEWSRVNEALADVVGGDPLTYEESELLEKHLRELGYK